MSEVMTINRYYMSKTNLFVLFVAVDDELYRQTITAFDGVLFWCGKLCLQPEDHILKARMHMRAQIRTHASSWPFCSTSILILFVR